MGTSRICCSQCDRDNTPTRSCSTCFQWLNDCQVMLLWRNFILQTTRHTRGIPHIHNHNLLRNEINGDQSHLLFTCDRTIRPLAVVLFAFSGLNDCQVMLLWPNFILQTTRHSGWLHCFASYEKNSAHLFLRNVRQTNPLSSAEVKRDGFTMNR